MADDTDPGGPDDDGVAEDPTPSVEHEIGAAVDDALSVEVRRQKARFVQAMMGIDRHEGVGRREAEREDRADLERDATRPDDPSD